MNRDVCRHSDVPFEVLQCARCGDAFRVCPGSRAWCPKCERGHPGNHRLGDGGSAAAARGSVSVLARETRK